MAMASDPLMVMNPYSDLNDLTYPLGSPPARKTPLTNKQRKARAKSKKAKKSRKRNR